MNIQDYERPADEARARAHEASRLADEARQHANRALGAARRAERVAAITVVLTLIVFALQIVRLLAY